MINIKRFLNFGRKGKFSNTPVMVLTFEMKLTEDIKRKIKQ
jgi:hypothetical protein